MRPSNSSAAEERRGGRAPFSLGAEIGTVPLGDKGGPF